MQGAAKVGLLLVVFIGLVFAAYSYLGQSLLGARTDTYYADFADANGIAEGARVLMAGVKVGAVSKVALLGPKQARLTLALAKGTNVPARTTVLIPTSLIGLGDTQVQLVPPDHPDGVAPVGSVLEGHAGNALDNVLPNSKETVAEFTRTLKAVRQLLEDQKLKGDVTALLKTTNATLDRFGKLANDVDATLRTNQSEIDVAIERGSQAVADVQRVTAAVAKLVDEGRIQHDTKGVFDNLLAASRRADKLVADIDRLVNDANLRRTMANVADLTETSKSVVANMSDITNTSKSIAKNTDEITKNGVKISANVVDLTERAKTVEQNAVDIENQLKGVLDKVGGFFGKKSSTHLPPIEYGMDLTRETSPGHWRTDLGVTFPAGEGRVNLGVYDAFEANKLTIQYGKDVTPAVAYRYGIYASKPGVGVDFRLTPRLYLRNDVWDINDPRYDARLRYEFGNGLIGWLGVDRIFHDDSLTIGIGFRR